MPKLKSYGVFISHAWDHNTEYDNLERMLDKAKRFKWRNCSVPKSDPLIAKTKAELENELRDQIRPANVVIVIAGMYVNNREWIQKEIDIALEMGKTIIAIKPHGALKVPTEVQQIAPLVSWQTHKIIDAIRNPENYHIEPVDSTSELSNEWQENITDSPDYSSLRDLIQDPEEIRRLLPKKQPKKIERSRGVSG